MHEKLAKALDYISDRHIAEAAGAKGQRRYWLCAVAAVLAVVLLINLFNGPMTLQAKAVSVASESRQADRDGDFDIWYAEMEQREAATLEALSSLSEFFADSSARYMAAGQAENRVWSPVNAFMALAALAETTGGNSRQQILEVLGTENLDTLRAQVGALWESVYRDDGHEISVLANSLWLDEGLSYDQAVMDNLAYFDYASVYQCDLGSPKSVKALQTWLNKNTGNLLKQYTKEAVFPGEAVMTLASTVYLQAKWGSPFSAAKNTQGAFHAPGGDITCTFMNKKELQTDYYWGDSFGAVGLDLKNGCTMWFFLPDAGKTVADVLDEGEYLDVITQKSENNQYLKVNLSVPKFDISSGGDLKEMFQALGVTDIFSPETADFTAITADTPVVITSVNQAARVLIDEEGVKAASYIELPGAGAAPPPEETIDFVLDRPFLFVIEAGGGIPLFVGAVNQP